ncbi:hypothetical protein LBMAG42_36940 [Deltaproteobacteria bacterium]|nr:hypothetical protein LBMAG42_36940 [Deltaproteobacteria bacterium]
MFAPISFILAFAASPALAADESVVSDSAESVSALVGNGDAAGKKKAKAAKGDAKKSKEAAPTTAPKSEGPAQNGSSSAPGKAASPAGSDRTGPAASGKQGSEARYRPDNQRPASNTSAARESSSGHEPASHESASHGSTERHESAGHASADRHSSTGGHVAADRHTAAARHAPATRARAARHRAVSHGYASHAYASHHAAWAAHRAPYHWYGPWRAGHPHYWYHGVFVYGPPVVYVGGGGGGDDAGGGGGSRAKEPKREVSRAGDWSIGVRGGSYLSGFQDGSGYGDAGLGIAARYRPIEPLGFEVAWTYHDATWSGNTSRIQQPLMVSAELFAFPWSRVSPYVLAGVTMTDRNIAQPSVFGQTFATEQDLWGPHGGLGIEFGLGKSASLNFDARFIGYVNKPVDDLARAGAVQANMGLNFYF